MSVLVAYFLQRNIRQIVFASVCAALFILYVFSNGIGAYYGVETLLLHGLSNARSDASVVWSAEYDAYFTSHNLAVCTFDSVATAYTPVTLDDANNYAVMRTDTVLRVADATLYVNLDEPVHTWTHGMYAAFVVRDVIVSAIILYVLYAINTMFNNSHMLHTHKTQEIEAINATPLVSANRAFIYTLNRHSLIGMRGELLYDARFLGLVLLGIFLGGMFVYRRIDIESITTEEDGLNGLFVVTAYVVLPIILLLFFIVLARYELYDLRQQPYTINALHKRTTALRTGTNTHASNRVRISTLFRDKSFNGVSPELVAVYLRNVAEKYRFGMLVWCVVPVVITILVRVSSTTLLWYCPPADTITGTCVDVDTTSVKQLNVCNNTIVNNQLVLVPVANFVVLQSPSPWTDTTACTVCEAANPSKIYLPPYLSGVNHKLFCVPLFSVSLLFFSLYALCYLRMRLVNTKQWSNRYTTRYGRSIVCFGDLNEPIRARLCFVVGLAGLQSYNVVYIHYLLSSPSPYVMIGSGAVGAIIVMCAYMAGFMYVVITYMRSAFVEPISKKQYNDMVTLNHHVDARKQHGVNSLHHLDPMSFIVGHVDPLHLH